MNDYKLLKECFKGDSVVWIVYMLFCIISIIEVFSAGSSLSFGSGNYLAPISNHCLMLAGGVAVAFGVHYIPTKYFRLIPYIGIPTSITLLLTLMLDGMISGDRINGASRWIFGFQPSEIGKMALVTWTAYKLARHQEEESCSPTALKPILIITGIIVGLIAPENGSTALLLLVVIYMMLIIGRIPKWQMLKLTGTIILVSTVAIISLVKVPPSVYKDIPGTHRFVTWRNRIIDYMNEEEVPAAKFDIDGKAQVAHSSIAIATSHVIGKGPGNSIQRDHLSHGYSDFIYAITIEEMGLIGGAFVAMLYLILLYRVGLIAKRADKVSSSLLIIGVALLLVCQALLHMMVSVGLFPVTGQPLPLISKGGTSIIFNSIYIGIIQNISRNTEQKSAVTKMETENDFHSETESNNKNHVLKE